MAKPIDPDSADRIKQSSLLATASSIGLALVFSILLGALGGYYVDKHFATSPFGFIIGLLLGVVAGFRNVYVLAQRLDNAPVKKTLFSQPPLTKPKPSEPEGSDQNNDPKENP
ncbi:MAG: AtpZ/AtpI family protein [Deltaproteobacteria bacterium]|jgi:ATP synthase protein I|nr:AtpZ/AtpI family protein [Deltaproteobacteria bacterium]